MEHKLNYEGFFFIKGSNNGGDLALPWKEKKKHGDVVGLLKKSHRL